jgi:hypothetical protein
MRQDERIQNEEKLAAIDYILASEEALVPSSGFLNAVMERVREEAVAPAPLPFPWKRALPGMLAAACVLGGGAVALVREGLPAMHDLVASSPVVPAGMDDLVKQGGWVALALGASLASWMVSKRLAGQQGLL